jgi:hypothetical protein
LQLKTTALPANQAPSFELSRVCLRRKGTLVHENGNPSFFIEITLAFGVKE